MVLKKTSSINKKNAVLTDAAYHAILEALDLYPEQLPMLLAPLHPADIADLVERLPFDKRDIITAHLEGDVLADVLVELDEGAQEHMLESLEVDDVKEVVSALESDDVADLVQNMEEDQVAEVKKVIDPKERSLLNHDPNTAGGLMQVELLSATENQTVGDVFKQIRRAQKGVLPEDIETVFVVDNHKKLLGTASITDMVQSAFTDSMKKVMRTDPVTVYAETDDADVIQLFEKYNVRNCAVVNKQGTLLGRITIDDAFARVIDAAERQAFRSAGVDETHDMFAPARTTTLHRLPWLILNLFTALLASFVILQFEAEIEQLVALAVLMPIVASMGGNAGTQTMTVAVRGLATGQMTPKNAATILWKEVLVGGYNGVFLALLLAVITFLFYGNAMLALVIALATIANHLFAAFAGLVVPYLLKKYRYDPAISSGVLVTTITDVGGFFVFLGLAAVMLL